MHKRRYSKTQPNSTKISPKEVIVGWFGGTKKYDDMQDQINGTEVLTLSTFYRIKRLYVKLNLYCNITFVPPKTDLCD